MNSEDLNILRKLHKNPEISQRNLSKELNLSLGKVNYCLNSLKAKGFLKIKNFRNNKNKINYLYILTPRGITQKTKITIRFMKEKMKEYDELKSELAKAKKKIKL
jgi:EPS-associated MarR family transcriptional regulator